MKAFPGRRTEAGQALVEFVALVPIIALFLSALVFFARAFTAKIILMQVVREGYLLMLYGDLSAEETRKVLERRFKGRLPRGLDGFDVRVERYEGFGLKPSRVFATGRLRLEGLSRRIINKDGVPVRAELAGYVDTWRGGLPPKLRKILPWNFQRKKGNSPYHWGQG